MKLLKLGDKVINLDLVQGFDLRGYREPITKVTVVFAGSSTGDPAAKALTTYEGTEGAALRQWIEAHAEDAMAPPIESPGAHL